MVVQRFNAIFNRILSVLLRLLDNRIIKRICNGRPMSFLGFAFEDIVSGRHVNYYYDEVNRIVWLAENKWSKFRMIHSFSLTETLAEINLQQYEKIK